MSHHSNKEAHKSIPTWQSFSECRDLLISATPAGIPSVFGKRASGARPLLSWQERVALSLLIGAAVFYEVEQDDIELWLRDELWINVHTNGTRPISFTDACHVLGLFDPPAIVRLVNYIRCSEPFLRLLSNIPFDAAS